MLYIKKIFKYQLKTTLDIVLIFSFILLFSCSDDDNGSPEPNYDGEGTIEFSCKPVRSESPHTLEVFIYDQNDNQLVVKTWDYNDFDTLIKESKNKSIAIENVPAGSQRKLVALGKNFSGNVVSRGEKETFSIEVSITPVIIKIALENFSPTPVTPEKNSISTTTTLPSFEWEIKPGAERYRITLYDIFQIIFFSKIVEDNTLPASEISKNIVLDSISATTTELLRPFQDTGQNQFFSETQEIFFMDPLEDEYNGQDAHFGNNSQSYTAFQQDGDGSYPVQNLEQTYTWEVTAIDLYGNESEPGDRYTFSIIWPLVYDNVTGLTWEVKTKDDDSIHDRDNQYTWQEVNRFINDLNQMQFGGYNDWRLPTIKELSFIISDSYKKLTATFFSSEIYFPCTDSAPYISSTMLSHYSTPYETDISAWHVDFSDGSVYEKNRSLAPVRVMAVRGETIESQYTDNGDGTVTDTVAKLMWAKDVQGPMTWKEALQYCMELNQIYSDWRLPNRNELQSLVDYNRNASVDTAAIGPVFTESDTLDIVKLPQYYWTSTTPIFKKDNAYTVSFRDGSVTYANKIYTENIFVRAVRDVQ